MSNLLLLTHRLPYPPNKGDKIRSYQILKHLSVQHQVYLATFIDDPRDVAYVNSVRNLCADVYVVRLRPRLAKVKCLSGLLRGLPLTLTYYEHSSMQRWVKATARKFSISGAVVFSSAMAQYVLGIQGLSLTVDFVDVDSAKWSEYASMHRWPFSWLYRREGLLLLEFEAAVAQRADVSFFVTEAEASLFRQLAPNVHGEIKVLGNGVDAEFFSPCTASEGESVFGPREPSIVFTGAMDYWPNIDAAVWFVNEVMPSLLRDYPTARFYIVGANPSATVRVLAGEHVVITGYVPDVRPYLRYATVVAAPLRIARGIQNKILEAMAMGRPIVVTQGCAKGIDAVPGRDFAVASDAQRFAEHIHLLISQPERARAMGRAARKRVRERYSWDSHLKGLDYSIEKSMRIRVSRSGGNCNA